MEDHECSSEQSLTTVRKWFFESGDGNLPLKTNSKSYPKINLILESIYDFIRNVFTVYDTNSLVKTCSICQFNKMNAIPRNEINVQPSYSSIVSTVKTSSLETIQIDKDNTNSPEIIFAESTCQLIKDAWL